MASKSPVNPMQMQQQNFLQRQAVLANSIKMTQQIASQTVDPASQNVLNIAPRNVGIILGFIVEVSGTIEALTGGGNATRTPFGTSNLVRQFRYDDLNNYTRIQTSGRHIAFLNTLRQGFGYGGVYANGLPMGYGDNFDVFAGPSTINAAANAAVRQVYYIPIAYSSTDLRGSIYSAVVSATQNLQIEINANPVIASGDSLNAVYTGNTGGGWDGDVTVTVYQVYLDQIPRDPSTGIPIIPILDQNTVYDLKETTFTGITAGQDFPFPYSNFRSFLSTMVAYWNGTSYGDGSDVNYWSLASANFTNIFKISPKVAALQARSAIMTDMPDGNYLFESRDIPINTINFGNQELNINAATAGAGARAVISYESFGLVNQLVGASSLAGG